MKNEDYIKAYKYCIRILSRRDYSRHKLETKLNERGYSTEIISELMDELISLRYLREENYIQSRVKGLARKGWSPQKIMSHLKQEKCTITENEIQNVCQEEGICLDSILDYLVEKKWGPRLETEREEREEREALEEEKK